MGKFELHNVDSDLEREFGEVGSESYEKAVSQAWDEYNAQVLLDARKEAGITQSELAKRVNSSKSYISQLERGKIVPSAGLFFRIMSALGIEVLFRKQESKFVI